MNGTAVQNSCNCYSLTPAQNFQAGSVWNKNKIDLTQSFDYHFNVFLGCITGTAGADGIVFALQPISTSEGSTGEGMGFGGITPSLGVSLDTYQNADDDDPVYDHIAFQANGDVNHADTNNLAGPVQALAGSPNLKDCNWHVLDVKWDAPTMTLTASMDGVERLTMTRDIVDSIFHGNPNVFWGFTGATGGSYNLQQFCTSLNANHAYGPDQRFCENAPITFIDSSTSFGSIVQWNWNFGDGTTSNLQNPPPHVYPTPGVYNVSEFILGNNGCYSDTDKTTVIIGSYPVAAFQATAFCSDRPLTLVNNTHDSVGSIASWNWSLSNGQTFSDSLPTIIPPQSGTYTLQLSVISAQGCASNSASATFLVNPTPQVNFASTAVCAGMPLVLYGNDLDPTPIQQWYWQLDSLRDSTESISHTYTQEDTLQVSLWAVSPQGCISDTVTQPVYIETSHANAGRDTAVALGYPIQLNGSGGAYYQWSPPDGLSNPDIADPIASISQDTWYTLTAYTAAGCASYASILIKVYKGPAIYIPSAFTPNGDGINDVLKIVAPGIRSLTYFRIFDRWGTEVFHTTDIQATWDGTMSGRSCPVASYVWMIQGIDLNGQTLTQRGTVMLMR
jgi:gliding motility-associated-like protein